MDNLNPAVLIAEYGFSAVAIVGLGYFVYFVYKFVNKELEPKLEDMHMSLIRLQEKIKVVLEYRERQELLDEKRED